MKWLIVYFLAVLPFFLSSGVEASTINWQRYTVSNVPIYPLDGECFSYFNQTPSLMPTPPSSDWWMAIRKINLTATTYNHQIDIDIFQPSGGEPSLPEDPPNRFPNFLTIRYRGEPFVIDYTPGLLVYDGSAKIKIIDGGTWCSKFDPSNPISVSYEVEYAFVTPSQANELNEWFWSDPIPCSINPSGSQIKGLFDRAMGGVSGEIINLKGLYAYSTIPLTLSFVLQGNTFINQKYWSSGEDWVRYYHHPSILGENPLDAFKVINHNVVECVGYYRVFIHAWGKRGLDLAPTPTPTPTPVLVVESMMIGKFEDFRDGVEEPLAMTKPWTLTKGDGLKTVYAKFKWSDGRWTNPVSDTITLQTAGPTPTATPTPTPTLPPKVTPTPTPTPTPMPTPTPIPTSTPTSTPTPTPEPGAAHLTFKVRFQGIRPESDKSEKTAILTLKKSGDTVYTRTIGISPDQSGIYTGRLTNVEPDTYDIFVRGWTHLQKKFAGVILSKGENTKDWSNIELLTGNANGDGEVNILDFGILVENYLRGTSIADFNLDGQTNIQDFRFIAEKYGKTGEE